jgi:class 3 adenylate cyclase
LAARHGEFAARRGYAGSVPLFIDRHDSPGASPEDVAADHMKDLAVQEQHGVRYYTYWFDAEAGSVFCLAEGPSREAVVATHVHAHGAGANTVLEIGERPLNDFLGAMPQHPPGTPYTAPAVRAILFTDICGSTAHTNQHGDDAHMLVLREHNVIVREAVSAKAGREVKHTGDGIMAAFDSVVAAVECAVAIQEVLDKRNQSADTMLALRIGISAGEPVTDDSDDLFGAAVQLARRLCDSTQPNAIAVSVAVRELCIGKSIRFVDRGNIQLKGFSEPVHAYEVNRRT